MLDVILRGDAIIVLPIMHQAPRNSGWVLTFPTVGLTGTQFGFLSSGAALS